MEFSITEFDRYCKGLETKYYIFDTDNQPSHYNKNINFVGKYQRMIPMYPDTICFKNNSSSISFDKVLDWFLL